MTRLFARLHVHSRSGAFVLACIGLICFGSVLALATARGADLESRWRSISIGLFAGFPGILLIAIVLQRSDERSRSERSLRDLTQRSRSVDRLLEFSQAVQAAGKADQIFPTLCHFLQNELGLSGVAIVSHEPDSIPATQLMHCRPADVIRESPPIAEMETRLCPAIGRTSRGR